MFLGLKSLAHNQLFIAKLKTAEELTDAGWIMVDSEYADKKMFHPHHGLTIPTLIINRLGQKLHVGYVKPGWCRHFEYSVPDMICKEAVEYKEPSMLRHDGSNTGIFTSFAPFIQHTITFKPKSAQELLKSKRFRRGTTENGLMPTTSGLSSFADYTIYEDKLIEGKVLQKDIVFVPTLSSTEFFHIRDVACIYDWTGINTTAICAYQDSLRISMHSLKNITEMGWMEYSPGHFRHRERALGEYRIQSEDYELLLGQEVWIRGSSDNSRSNMFIYNDSYYPGAWIKDIVRPPKEEPKQDDTKIVLYKPEPIKHLCYKNGLEISVNESNGDVDIRTFRGKLRLSSLEAQNVVHCITSHHSVFRG